MANTTTLTKGEFETFVRNSQSNIQSAYEALRDADLKFSAINEYQGAYQTAIANSWSSNYSKAVSGLADLYSAIGAANSAASNLIYADQTTASNRP